MNKKKCSKCKKLRLIKFFYFRKDSNTYRNECKKCMGKEKRKYVFIDNKNKLKQCSKCREIKSFSEFYRSNNHKNGLNPSCKKCKNKIVKKYRDKNKKSRKIYGKNYRQRLKEKYPWIYSYKNAKNRCNNPNSKDYKWYGGRGIKFLLTYEDCIFLWNRDKAWLLKKPSIDRIDNDAHYELNNCQFIENITNIKKSNYTMNYLVEIGK